MQITPFGRVDAKFDALSKLGSVTPRPRKAMPVPEPLAPRVLQNERPSQREAESLGTDQEAPAPVLRDVVPRGVDRLPRPPAATTPAQQPGRATSPSLQTAAVTTQEQPDLLQGDSAPSRGQGEHTALLDSATPLLAGNQATRDPATISLPSQITATTRPVAAVNGQPLSPALAKATASTPPPQAKEVQRPSSTPRSEKMAELAREQRDSIFRSIALSLSEKGGKAHFRLEPRELGSLGVELELEGDKLRVRVRVEREELASVLREDLPKLQQQLEARGFVIQGIDVETSSRQEQQQAAIGFQNKHRPQTSPGTPGTADATEAAPSGLLGKGLGLRLGSGIDFLA